MLQVAFLNTFTVCKREKWEKPWLDFQKEIGSPLEDCYATGVNIAALQSR